MLTLFLVGVIEMIIATAWTRLVSKAQVLASGAITIVNIFIWYYVLRVIIDDISNWQLIVTYAIGCAAGTVVGTYFFQWLEKQRRIRAKKAKMEEKKYDESIA